MNLSKKAEAKLQKAVESPKVHVKTLKVIEEAIQEGMTHAEILALGLLITQTSRKVLEEKR